MLSYQALVFDHQDPDAIEHHAPSEKLGERRRSMKVPFPPEGEIFPRCSHHFEQRQR
jgi:hypothetical protein